MEDNLNTIIANAVVVDKKNLPKKIRPLIDGIKEALTINQDAFKATNLIDEKNKNGFVMDFNIIENIFKNLKSEGPIYGDVISSINDDKQKIIYGKEVLDIGTVLIISDGNPYSLLEVIIRNIMAGNSVIVANEGYMYGTNNLLVELIANVLEQFDISKHLVQIYTYEKLDDVLKNYANIDLTICVGNHELQQLVLSKAKTRVLTSGYEYFDLYIEDTTNVAFINKIVASKLNLNIYVKEDIYLEYPNSITVMNLDEAIANINYNGSRYSAAIFTSSSENASRFLKEVHAKMVTVNTSPSIERLIDIKVADLTNLKTIIYPEDYKLTGKPVKIDLDK